MPHSSDDAELLAHMARGDQQALELLVERYHARLWRYLARHLDAHSIEDVLQEIYLAFWHAAGSFRGDSRPSTWLYQIAHHHLVTAQVAERRHQTQTDRFTLAEQQTTPSPENAVAARIDLAQALRTLSRKHLETLDLVYFHGFTIDETAHILGIPSGTVKSRLSQARERLHAIIGKGARS